MNSGFQVGTEGWVDLPPGMSHVSTSEGCTASFYEIDIPGVGTTMIVARHDDPPKPIIDGVRARVAELASLHHSNLIVCGSVTASSIPVGSITPGILGPEPLETL